MKIASWNINGIESRLDNLCAWLGAAAPDVLCLQELKCAASEFPADALEAAGYGAVWRAEGRWNGVAILARDKVPVLTRLDLPGDSNDAQARYIEAAIDGWLIASIYAPNGNPQPGPKFEYKLAWLARLHTHASELLGHDIPIVLAGDYNVAPEPRDVYETRSYDENALVQPQSRAAFDGLLQLGLVDTLRRLYPDATAYTFWDYRRRRWERNAGLRLDHILMNTVASGGLERCGIDRDVRGMKNASDHAPVWIESSRSSAQPSKA